jgi:hypothetical protein
LHASQLVGLQDHFIGFDHIRHTATDYDGYDPTE